MPKIWRKKKIFTNVYKWTCIQMDTVKKKDKNNVKNYYKLFKKCQKNYNGTRFIDTSFKFQIQFNLTMMEDICI